MSEDTRGGLPKLLFVVASNRRRGAEVFTEQLTIALRDRGWKAATVALTGSDDGARVSIPVLAGIPLTQVGRFNKTISRRLRERVEQERPDIVVAMGGSTLRYSVVATTWSSSHLAYFAIGEPEYWLRSGLSRVVNRWLIGRADRVMAVSEVTAEQLARLNPKASRRIVVARTGVASRFFDLERHDHEGPRRAVFIGSLSYEKDPLLAIRSISRSSEWVLRIIGTGPMLADVESMLDELSVADRVELMGTVGDTAPHLEWADALLLTSRTEGLPGVVLEAAASGRPSIVVDVGGTREAVDHDVTGIVGPRDEARLADLLTKLANDPEALVAMGDAARKRAMEDFRLELAVDRFESILTGLLT